MKIDLTCPVELWQYSMPSQQEPECTFVLNNLSDKVVVSVQVTLICHDREGKLLYRQIERIQGLSAGGGERFSIMLLPGQWQDVAGIELVIEKVWFDDATIWRRGNTTLTEFTPNALPPGRALDELQFVAGKDAVGYPQEQDHVWMCVCGRPNSKNNQRCCRCARRAETVFASYQKDNVDQLIAVHEQKLREISAQANQKASQLIQEQEAFSRHHQNHRKLVFRLGLGAAAAAMVLAVLLLWVLPSLRYSQAQNLLADSKFGEAKAAFAQMGAYGDSALQVIRCDYLQAKSDREAGTLDGLQKAADGFLALGDYEDSRQLWQQCIYQMGQMELALGAYESAAELFQQLGDYQDSADQLKETTYQQADKLMEGDGLSAAQALFRSLGTYKQSAEKVLACEYAMALMAEENNDLQAAIQHYEILEDYRDAPQRLQADCYSLAEAKLAEGAAEEAGLLYLQAGDYQDARLKANNSLYQLGQQTMQDGDYAKAEELFEQIQPYLDSEGLAFECQYRQGEAALQAMDYARAAELFAGIPYHKDAGEKAKESQYLQAKLLLDQGSAAEAVALLENLGSYQDSAELLEQTRYELAGQAMSAGEYAQAATLYEAAGKYLDSVTLARQARYQAGQAALVKQDYQAAAEAFTALGKYQDAPEKLATAVYQLAMQQKAQGDMSKAAELLSTLPQGDETQTQLLEITLAEAKNKQDAGDLEGASALYLALGDVPEAKDGYATSQYQLALQLIGKGEPVKAGGIFEALGDFQDAAAQAAACYEQAFGEAAAAAREAFQRKDYRVVVESLDGLDLASPPQEYKDLRNLYNQACYAYANLLYGEGKPFEALPYYQRVPGYRDVAESKLTRRIYLVLGTWESATGKQAVFRADGTCNLMGQELYYDVDAYALLTGDSPERLSLTHKISSITQTRMTLRGSEQGSTVYKFTHISAEAPEPAATPANPLDEMLVQEEDNATPKPTHEQTASPALSI